MEPYVRMPAADQTVTYKNAKEIAQMRESGRIVASIVKELKCRAEPGMTTLDLDRIAADIMKRHGATSTALHYPPGAHPKNQFPGHICVSLNDQVVHGIPGPRRLRLGDLIKVDVAASYQGWVADTAASFTVGPPSPKVEKLLRITEEALHRGIEQARPGNRMGDISNAIQRHVESNGLAVVREFVGHGVGRSMHEAPQVPHLGPAGQGRKLLEGLCLAIEPQVNLGQAGVRMLDDGWTAVTLDGSWSAHFEHTVAVTADGPLVLTLP